MEHVGGNHSAEMARLGATLVALLQRCQVAEAEGRLVEVLEIEIQLAVLRAELASAAQRQRGWGPTGR